MDDILLKYLRGPNPTVDGFKDANTKSKAYLANLVERIRLGAI
jgi:hypothetical protein